MVQAHGTSAAGSATEMKKTGVLLMVLLPSAGPYLHVETRQALIASVPCPQASWVRCVLSP